MHMRERDHWLVRGGHSHSILSLGPFEIGTDFQPPTPAARALWNIKVEPSVLESLHRCLERTRPTKTNDLEDPPDDTSIFADAVAHSALANGVEAALKWYVSDFQFQPDEKVVRKKIKKLKSEINRFKSALPQQHDAVGRFIWQTYTGEAFLRDDLKPTEPDLIALQDAWNGRFGLLALHDSLDVVIRYVSAAEQCLGKKKPLEHRKARLVRSLAQMWRELTGEWPTSGRDPQTSNQIGPFADFVRIACGILPKEFHLSSLDPAIRKVCEHTPRNFPTKNSTM